MKCLLGHKAASKLFCRLLTTAVISSLLILSAASFGVSTLYYNHVIEDAEADAVGVGRSILALEKHLLVQRDQNGQEYLKVTPAAFQTLDEVMQKALGPLNVLKVKVFSPDGIILYSTDHSIIGRNNADNLRLQTALSGGFSSELEYMEAFTDLSGEKHFNVNIVETYLPILTPDGKVIGSFEIYQDVSPSLVTADIGIRQALATLAVTLCVAFSLSFLIIRVAARELRQTQDKLHHQASVDTLTGLFNRNKIMQSLMEETERLQASDEEHHIRQPNEQNTSYCLIMLDVDHFKSINDNYGHPAGDKVLKVIAQTIKHALRADDQVGRYGGEEFLLILPETDLESAWIQAERVRSAIENLSVRVEEKEIPVTASLGVATKYPVESDYEGVLKRADDALYQAKSLGRNRVEQACFNDHPAQQERLSTA